MRAGCYRTAAEPGAFKTASFLRLEDAAVEGLRRYGPEAVERLRRALAGGVPFNKDPKRKRFYEVQVGNEHFYIHVFPRGRKVLLLSGWKLPA